MGGVDRAPEGASEATGTGGAEDASPENDDSPEYYIEWIEASNPHLISATHRQWQALLTSAKPSRARR